MNISAFDFNGFGVRVVNDSEGNPWFVAADIATVLDYGVAKDMTRNLDDDEKAGHKLPTPGGYQEMAIINESGLYSAIIKSRKPEAKAFKKWITSEVLPSIRKTGSYSVNAHNDQPHRIPLDEIARSLEVANNMLNICPSGKLKSLRQLYTNYGVNTNILPSYTVDAPTITAGSSEPTISITEMIRRSGLNITPIAANKKLQQLGFIRQESRPSSRGNGVKNFWVVSGDGLKYGKNVTSDRNQKETQPHWYLSKMNDLIELLNE